MRHETGYFEWYILVLVIRAVRETLRTRWVVVGMTANRIGQVLVSLVYLEFHKDISQRSSISQHVAVKERRK
jgi:hypothetical protein